MVCAVKGKDFIACHIFCIYRKRLDLCFRNYIYDKNGDCSTMSHPNNKRIVNGVREGL